MREEGREDSAREDEFCASGAAASGRAGNEKWEVRGEREREREDEISAPRCSREDKLRGKFARQ